MDLQSPAGENLSLSRNLSVLAALPLEVGGVWGVCADVWGRVCVWDSSKVGEALFCPS